ncbi:MAG: single-stranded DNA-binding protein [Desulforudis sp.]|nr:MAG: single-stranded DNA-binding protein [Desulforudis sp.]
MLNSCILIGRLVRDPEMNYTAQGTPVTRFTIAVDRGFADTSGKKQTDFVDVVVWRDQAESVAKYLAKGRLVTVQGRLQIRSYDDSQGVRRKAAEIVAQRVVFMPDGKKNDAPGGVEPPPLPEDPWVGGDDEPIPF